MNGDKERPTEQGANMERVVNNCIILNTLANGDDGTAEEIVRWGWGSYPLKPTKNSFRGNIITAKNGKLLYLGNHATASGNTISDNIGWITGRATYEHLRPEMATRIDPQLRENSDGIYLLQSGSPACNKFTGTPFSSLTTVDIYGETRSRNTDAGCDQYSTSTSRMQRKRASTKPKKRITTEDVGPGARTSLGDSPAWNPRRGKVLARCEDISRMQRKRKSTSRMQRKRKSGF
jgi:hypothetical protein